MQTSFDLPIVPKLMLNAEKDEDFQLVLRYSEQVKVEPLKDAGNGLMRMSNSSPAHITTVILLVRLMPSVALC